jgi:hypothetical protein
MSAAILTKAPTKLSPMHSELKLVLKLNSNCIFTIALNEVSKKDSFTTAMG